MRQLPTRALRVDVARDQYGEQADQLLDALWRSDPLADAVVEDFETLAPGAGFQLLEQALGLGVDSVHTPPESLKALFAQLDHPPSWVEWERLERAGRVFFRSSLAGGIVLGAKSLALGYCSPGGNKALVQTGRLTQDMARRIGETGRFAQATCTRHGLQRDQLGFAITVKVRIMHAQVRRLIAKQSNWKSADWGAPINQHDMVATMLLFSLVFVDGVRQLGVQVSDAELEDFFQLWRYAGYLIGIEESLLPRDVQGARDAERIIFITQGLPDADSRMLVRALAEAPLHEATTKREKAKALRQARLGYGFLRVLLGTELADALHLPNDAYRFAVPAIHGLVRGAGRIGGRVKGAERLAELAGKRYWDAAVQESVGRREPSYAFPQRLRTDPKR